MFAEFIDRPTSGEYHEKHFGDTDTDCSWVKFTSINGEEWVGSFQRGWLDQSLIVRLLDNRKYSFVIASGSAYLINIATHQLVYNTETSYVKTVLVDDEQLIVYYSNGFDLRIVDIHGNETCLFEYSGFDDIELTDIRGSKLYATYFDYQDITKQFQIEVDLLTKEVRNSFYNVKPSVISSETQIIDKPKPWWKFW